jgi:hypothetical protein
VIDRATSRFPFGHRVPHRIDYDNDTDPCSAFDVDRAVSSVWG